MLIFLLVLIDVRVLVEAELVLAVVIAVITVVIFVLLTEILATSLDVGKLTYAFSVSFLHHLYHIISCEFIREI